MKDIGALHRISEGFACPSRGQSGISSFCHPILAILVDDSLAVEHDQFSPCNPRQGTSSAVIARSARSVDHTLISPSFFHDDLGRR
jgi:hypothetical protein